MIPDLIKDLFKQVPPMFIAVWFAGVAVSLTLIALVIVALVKYLVG